MQSQILTKYAQTANLALSANTDILTPYSFQEWQSRNFGIIPSKGYVQYNDYLKNWYIVKVKNKNSKEFIRQQYISLLNELSINFDDQNTNLNWLTPATLDDDWDLETLIPIYAQKLKEIAIYLSEKRESLKKTKLKYNMVGATQALERLFYRYLLKAFTKKNTFLEIPSLSAWQSMPELSAVGGDFQLEIEELYDDEEYYDKNPNVSVNEYFDLSTKPLLEFISTQNFPTSALEWLYSTGFVETCALSLWSSDLTANSNNPLSAFEAGPTTPFNEYNYFDLSTKYLGEKQWLIVGEYNTILSKLYTFDLKALNNWFYWPSGEIYNDLDKPAQFNSIALSASNFALNATASTTSISADKIFVRKGQSSIEAAWLAQVDYETTTETMSALLESKNKTIFRFPWAGFGLSGEDVQWTGPSLINVDKSFDYLEKKYRDAITDIYWSPQTTVFDSYNVDPIFINNTNLFNNGAAASTNFDLADKITIRKTVRDITPDAEFNDEQSYAWLYDFKSTQIPIASGSNSILWPLLRLDTSTAAPSSPVPINCNSVPLSSLRGLIGSTAGLYLSASDIIFKLDSFSNAITEVAWLSGKLNTTATKYLSSYITTLPFGFSTKVDPGKYSLFLWADIDTDVKDVFKYVPHANDCPYKVAPRTLKPLEEDVLGNLNTVLGDDRWDYCNCRAFHYSPCGHSGNMDDYGGLHDFIIEDVQYPDTFDFSQWRDDEDLSVPSRSSKFVWYQTTTPGINYNLGTWTNSTSGNLTLILKKGHVYRYYRTNLKRDPDLFSIPYIVTTFPHSSGYVLPTWTSASRQANNTWVSTGSASKMVLNTGDTLIYYHYDLSEKLDDLTTKNAAINFVLNTPVTSTPYWAIASDDSVTTQYKGKSVYGGVRQIVDDYSLIYQAGISEISLENGTYLEYERIGKSIIWTEQLELRKFIGKKIWYTLLSDTINGLNIVATVSASNIVLESNNDNPTEINYYAINPFTFTQTLSDTTSVLVPLTSSALIEPLHPYFNFTNQHFPTIASAPTISKFYTEEDTGGFFVPKTLGINTFLGKQYRIG